MLKEDLQKWNCHCYYISAIKSFLCLSSPTAFTHALFTRIETTIFILPKFGFFRVQFLVARSSSRFPTPLFLKHPAQTNRIGWIILFLSFTIQTVTRKDSYTVECLDLKTRKYESSQNKQRNTRESVLGSRYFSRLLFLFFLVFFF